jgi:hypothetical protein
VGEHDLSYIPIDDRLVAIPLGIVDELWVSVKISLWLIVNNSWVNFNQNYRTDFRDSYDETDKTH